MVLLRVRVDERIMKHMGKLRRGFGVAIATAITAPLLALPAAAHGAPDDPEPTRIMIVGDSITHGESGHATWRYRLWKEFERTGQADDIDFVGPRSDLFGGHGLPTTHDYAHPDFDQDHASVWGASFSRYAENMGLGSTLEMLRDNAPDVILLQLGVNDLTWGGMDPTVVAGLARAFVADARAAKPDVDIVIGELTLGWNAQVAAYNAVLPALVAELDTESSDVLLAVQPQHVREVDTYDLSHPSASGEAKIAKAYAPALVELGVLAAAPRTATSPPPPKPSTRPPIKVGKPDVRAKAAGRRLVVRWSRATKATRYQVKHRRVGRRWKTTWVTQRKWSKRVKPGRYVVRVQGWRDNRTGEADVGRARVGR